MEISDNEELITAERAGRLLGMSRYFIRKETEAGALQVWSRTRKGHERYRRGDILAYREAMRVPPQNL